jgi:hypothetical protein
VAADHRSHAGWIAGYKLHLRPAPSAGLHRVCSAEDVGEAERHPVELVDAEPGGLEAAAVSSSGGTHRRRATTAA